MKNTSKLTALLLAVLLVCATALSGCSQGGTASTPDNSAPAQSATAADGDLLAQIKEKGEVTIAMEGTWAPWTYHDETDKLVGYDVEVGQYIADYIGVKANFIEGDWEGLLAGLESGRYDMMINGVTVDESRKEKYRLSTPYAYDHTAVVVQDTNSDIQSLDDLNGKKTANTLNSVYAHLAEEHGAEVTGVDDLNQTFELLLSGRIDATLNSELTYYDYMKEHPDAPLKIAVMTEEANETAIPLRNGDDTASLMEAINGALEEMRQNGKLAELSEKYFGSDITKAS